MKRLGLCILTIFILILPSYSGKFGKYDFTFYKTVDDSIAIMNMERLGFDYTGYGYIGENMTTGLYIRFGMQAPYSTLFSLFEPVASNSSSDSSHDSTDQDTSMDSSSTLSSSDSSSSIIASTGSASDSSSTTTDDSTKTVKYDREFAFSFTIGPAFRHFISNSVMWYMGMGVSGTITQNVATSSSNAIVTSFALKFGTDLDSGFRLDLAERTSLRLGVHITTGLLTYTNSTVTSSSGSETTNSLAADIFTKVGEESSTKFAGYIGLGHVFKPNAVEKYTYSNKTRKLGGGSLAPME